MISLYFGSPGSGKSTLAARLVYKNYNSKKNDKYDVVYTNFACKGASRFDSSDFAIFRPLENSLVIIDEAGIDFNNRKFKDLKQSMIEFFKLHRHYAIDIIFLSQSWEDVDITIRRLADELIYIKKIGPFTRLREVRKFVTCDKDTRQIVEGYEFLPIWYLLFLFPPFRFKSPVKFFFRPPYYHMFDSYSCPPRPVRKLQEWSSDYVIPHHSFFNWLSLNLFSLKTFLIDLFNKIKK